MTKTGFYLFQIMSLWQDNKPSALYSFAIRKRSVLKRFVTMVAIKQIESGAMDFGLKRHLHSDPVCTPLLKEVEPLSFKKICTLFYMMAFGLVLALLAFFTEKISARQRSNAARDTNENSDKTEPVRVLENVTFCAQNNKELHQEDMRKFEKIVSTIRKSDFILNELHRSLQK